jgi:ATP-dependent exoDNAse (exonuclease V) alpha subunit
MAYSRDGGRGEGSGLDRMRYPASQCTRLETKRVAVCRPVAVRRGARGQASCRHPQDCGKLARDVIILDEVSMVSIPQLARLAALIEEKKARLVTLGDSDQHHSVERGDAIRILQESGSVRSVQLTETYRAQVQYLKDTVLDLKAGRREEGYARLEEHGDIREIQDLHKLRQEAVDTHLEAVRAGHLAILASPVHAEARAAAQIVREALKAED